MATLKPDASRLRVSVEDLCENLARIRALHEELLEVLHQQTSALVEVRTAELPEIRDREEALLRRVIEEEKERLLITEEVGDLIHAESPVATRVAQILPHLPEDLAERLSGERERLCEVSIKLGRQNSVNRALIEHSVGHIQIFMSKLARAASAGPRYDRSGKESDGGDAHLMDRRG